MYVKFDINEWSGVKARELKLTIIIDGWMYEQTDGRTNFSVKITSRYKRVTYRSMRSPSTALKK